MPTWRYPWPRCGAGGALVALGHGSSFSTPFCRGITGQDQAGSQRAASWAGQDPSRALGKGEEGCRVGRGHPWGQDGGPLESVGAQRG